MTVITMSRTEIDRMGVLHDLANGRIKIAEASRLMGLGRRQVFRLAKAYGKHGPEALVSRRRGRPSNRCYPTALRTEVVGIIKDRYSDFGPTLAAEKLAELHGIHLARETLRQWMIMAGLWTDQPAIDHSMATMFASKCPTSTRSPIFLPMSARATGETYEMLPLAGSASSSPTMRNVCRRPSLRLSVTVDPKCTSSGLANGETVCALARRCCQ